MKKKAIVRGISLLMAGLMVVSLSACKKKTQNTSVAGDLKKNANNAVFSMSKSLTLPFSGVFASGSDNGFIFFATDSGTFNFAASDKDGNMQPSKSYKLSADNSDVSPANVGYANDGSIYLLDEVSDYDNNEFQYTLVHISADGSEIGKADFKDQRPMQLVATGDGNVVARFDGGVIVLYDSNCNEVSRIANSNAAVTINDVIADGNDILVFQYDDSNKSTLHKANFQNKSIGDAIPYPQLVGGYVAGNGYDFYNANGTSYYGIDIASNTATEVFNLMDSDVDSDSSSVIMLDKETALVYNNAYSGGNSAGIFKKVPPSEVANREVFIVGCFNISPDMKKNVVAFNQSNTKYRLKIVDYSIYNTADTQYKGGLNVFKTDVASNNIPDIMLTTGLEDVQGYMRKGLFTDMTPLMEKAGLNKSDYLDNILSAGSQDGKLYLIMPFFSVRGYSVKTSLLNGKSGLSIDDFMELEKKYDDVGKSIWYCSKDQVIQNAILYNTTDYMDLETGKCNFDSDDFKKILVLANEFPAGDQDSLNQVYGGLDYLSTGVSNKLLISTSVMASFRDTYRSEQSYYGENASYIGFPDLQGNSKPVISPWVSIAISSKCQDKDGAFEFVKYMLSADVQKSKDNGVMGGNGFPILKTALEDMANSAMEPYASQNTDGTWSPVPDEQNSYQLGNKTYVYQPLTQERKEYYMSVITSADKLEYSESKILDIISEETAGYFAGQKSVDQVTPIIQSRVSIYVNENQ